MNEFSSKTPPSIGYDEVDPLAVRLGLTSDDENTYYGTFRGYPLGLVIEDSTRIQIHHSVETPPLVDCIAWSAVSRDLVEGDEVEIRIEPRHCFLVVPGQGEWDDEKTVEVLSAVVDSLQQAGIVAHEKTCHYCHLREAPDVQFLEYLAVRICKPCLDGLRRARDVEEAHELARPFDVAVIVFTSCLGSAACAMLWFLLWRFRAAGPTNTPWLDDFVMPIISFGKTAVFSLLFLIASPVGWLVRQIPRRKGCGVAGMVAVFTVVGIVLGESVLAHHHGGYEGLFPDSWWKELWSYWRTQPLPLHFLKVFLLLSAPLIAAGIADLDRRPLKL